MNTTLFGVLAASLLLSACGTLASDEIEARRIGYIDALAMTDREEILSNIVRLRYNEVPVFLRVEQITSNVTTTREGAFSLGLDPDWSNDGSTVEGEGSYRLNPTISYVPLSGRQFSNRLIVPFDLKSFSLMLRNGFDFDVVANLMLASMDGHSAERGRAQADKAAFRALASEISDLISSGAVIVAARTGDHCGEDGFELVLIETGLGAPAASDRLFAQFADITPEPDGLRELPICLTAGNSREDMLAVRTRSLLSTMSYLSYGVENPDAFEGWDWQVGDDQIPTGLIDVRSGPGPPDGRGDTAIEYRGQWFWIEGEDRTSNNTLYLLRVLLNLQAQVDDEAERAVQLTLPVN